jgi:alkylation response protein AidB-like acyl-CoA dehydrogenase
MNFEHTEERRMLADSLNRFIAERYNFETRNKIAGSAEGYSPEMWNHFAELGVIGALMREEDGGFGGAGFDIAMVFEALGRGLVLEPLLASPCWRAKRLPRAATKRSAACWSRSPTAAPSPASRMTSRTRITNWRALA